MRHPYVSAAIHNNPLRIAGSVLVGVKEVAIRIRLGNTRIVPVPPCLPDVPCGGVDGPPVVADATQAPTASRGRGGSVGDESQTGLGPQDAIAVDDPSVAPAADVELRT